MARSFDAAQFEYLYNNVVTVPNAPLAMVCWFKCDDIVNYHALMWIGDYTSDVQTILLQATGGSEGDPVNFQMKDSPAWALASTSSGYSVDTWHHACGIWASDTDRRVFIDGGSKGTNADSCTPTPINAASIGVMARLTKGAYMSGCVAEAAIYDLSDWPGIIPGFKADAFEKILPSLAKGYSPLNFPLGLNNYWPLLRAPEHEIINNKYLVAYNTPGVADHPEIILPRTAQRGQPVRVFQDIPPFMQKDLITPHSGGAWLWLCEIAVPGYDTQYLARNTEDINYFGKLYRKSNIDIGKQEFSGGGSIPRIQLRIRQGPDKVIEGIVNESEGVYGGTVKLIRVNEKYLNYKVETLELDYGMLAAESDAEWLYFTLGIPNPLTQRIPLHVGSSKVCPWALPALFKGPECQYSGSDLVCTGTFDDCYTKGNSTHWGGEIGLDPNVARI